MERERTTTTAEDQEAIARATDWLEAGFFQTPTSAKIATRTGTTRTVELTTRDGARYGILVDLHARTALRSY